MPLRKITFDKLNRRTHLYAGMFNARLNELSQTADAPFIGAGVEVYALGHGAVHAAEVDGHALLPETDRAVIRARRGTGGPAARSRTPRRASSPSNPTAPSSSPRASTTSSRPASRTAWGSTRST